MECNHYFKWGYTLEPCVYCIKCDKVCNMKRIVKKDRKGYFILYKWLFWWFSERELQVCINGLAWEEIRYFKTKKEANNFIKETN